MAGIMQYGTPRVDIRSPGWRSTGIHTAVKLPGRAILEMVRGNPRQKDINRIGHNPMRLTPVIVQRVSIHVIIDSIGVILAEVEEKDGGELMIAEHGCASIPGPGQAVVG